MPRALASFRWNLTGKLTSTKLPSKDAISERSGKAIGFHRLKHAYLAGKLTQLMISYRSLNFFKKRQLSKNI